MTSVSSVTSTSGTGSLAADSLSATQDRFLKLLVAQMNNQDPLNPLDNSQVTSQMAQLSTVSGINKLNDQMSALANSFSQAQSLQASSMIGHGVFTAGNLLVLGNNGALAGVDLPQNVDSVAVTIRNAAGQVVHNANLGAQPSGMLTLQWDGATNQGGTAANGTYTFEVQALSGGKQVSGMTPYSFGLVNSVTLGSDGATLNLNGIGSISMSQVKQIL